MSTALNSHAAEFRYVPVGEIVAVSNCREDMGDLDGLAESIREVGICQPIHLQGDSAPYTLVAGERRWRAAQLAGLPEVPAIVMPVDAHNRAIVSLVENAQRQDLNAIEEALAFRSLTSWLSQTGIAQVIGKQQSYVSNSLRLLKLPAEVQEQIRSGELSRAHGIAVLMQAKGDRLNAARQIARLHMSSKRAERIGKDSHERTPTEEMAIMALLDEVHRTADALYSAAAMGNDRQARSHLFHLHDQLNWARGMVNPLKAEEYTSQHREEAVSA